MNLIDPSPPLCDVFSKFMFVLDSVLVVSKYSFTTDVGFPSDWFMDALHFNEAFELARIQGFSFFYWRGNKYKVK